MTAQVLPFRRTRFTWLAYLMLAYYAYSQAILGPIMIFLSAEFRLDDVQIGWHLSAFALGTILGGAIADRLANRWGRAVIFWGGGGGMAAGALLLVSASNSGWSTFASFVMGFLGVLLLVTIQSALSDLHGTHRAIAFLESNVAASVAAAFAPFLVGGFERLDFGWRWALVIAAVAWGVAIVGYGRLLVPERLSSVSVESSRRKANGRLPLLFWVIALVGFLLNAVEWAMAFWGGPFLERVVGMSKTDAATIMTAFYIAMVTGRFAGSRLSVRFSTRILFVCSLGVCMVGFPLFWLGTIPALNVLGLFVTGLGVANLFPLTLSLAVNTAPVLSDSASARISMVNGIAVLTVPQVIGFVASASGIFNAYMVVAVLLITAVVLTTFMLLRLL